MTLFRTLALVALMTGTLGTQAFAADPLPPFPGAGDRPEGPTDGLALPMKPQRINVAYSTQDGDLILRFTSLPLLNGCGQVTNMPVKLSYDTESADITVGDYRFVQPLGTNSRDCGSVAKVSSAVIRLNSDDLANNQVARVRLWHDRMLDTLYVVPGKTKGDFTLRGPVRARFFDLAAQPSMIDAPAPQKSTEAAPLNVKPGAKTLRLRLARPGVAGDFRRLAHDRGLAPTNEPDIFIDQGGQFYLQLKFTPELSIGTIDVNGEAVPVMASRITQ